MDMPDFTDCQTSYDQVADEYARRLFGELQHKPLDRALLDRFAASAREAAGLVCDMGCGPGQVARYLHERGVRVCGVDLSATMVELARRLTPGVEFQQGDMMALDVPDATWSGIVAFYSIIHIPRGSLTRALGELRRVLRPGGPLLLAFHVGEETIHLEEWWDRKVCVDFFFLQPAEVADALRAAGFELEETIEREPYPEVEHPSRRAYVFARKPQANNREVKIGSPRFRAGA